MKPQVLILDDSLTERMALRTLLSSAGCMVSACGTLQMAREMVRRRAFDLALLDVLLPDGSGVALLEEIKADPQTNHMMVILVSSLAEKYQAQPGAQWRADAYFQKPYQPELLAQRVLALMQQSLGGKRYLVVDDSPTFVQALSSKLRQAGNEVLVAASGEEAIELLSKHTVDCAIIDMVMPGMGGLATCQRIRELPGGDELPIVMLTASENLCRHSEGQTALADDFLIKQYDMELLNTRLREILRKAALRPKRKSDRISIPKLPEAQAQATGSKVYEQALVLTGLSHWVARLAMSRACISAAVSPATMTSDDLQRLLPALGEVLRLFMAPEDAAAKLQALKEFAESGGTEACSSSNAS